MSSRHVNDSDLDLKSGFMYRSVYPLYMTLLCRCLLYMIHPLSSTDGFTLLPALIPQPRQ